MAIAAAALAAPFLGMVAVGAAPTRQATGGAKAAVLGNVAIDPANPQIAYVTAQYTCPAGGEAHLWVSVKQTDAARPDNALKTEGSSQKSAAWLQRHPDPATEFTCDGAWHTGTFSVDAGLTEYGFGALVPGQVYVQFCLTGPEIAPEQPAWFAIDQRFTVAR